MSNKKEACCALTFREPFRVRFSEVDSMRIVWHGEYIRYFEDGREAFGHQYGISYLDIFNQGYTLPVVEVACQYKQSLTMGDTGIIEVCYVPTESAKVCFEYRIFRDSDHALVATGSSVQVFLDQNNELVLLNPPFYLEWKKRWKVL